MPYKSVSELPAWVRKLPLKRQRQFMHVWNSVYQSCIDNGNDASRCESRAFAAARSVVAKKVKSLSEISTLSFHLDDTSKIVEMLSKFTPPYTIEQMQEDVGEKFKCECLKCGYVMESDKHCADIKCPKCGGTMRRVDRPGQGRLTDEEDDRLIKYTVDGILEELLLSEKHIRDFLDDKNTICTTCLKEKHLPLIKALSKEGSSLTKDQRKKETFLNCATLAAELIPMVDNLDDDTAMKMQDTIRDIRKNMSRIMGKYPNTGVLSEKAMYLGWVPEKGVSGLTKEAEESVPPHLRFWEKDDEVERIDIRNRLAEAILSGDVVLTKDDLLYDRVSPPDPPESPSIRDDGPYKPGQRTIWSYHQNADRIEFDGILLSYGAWNGYYYPPDVIDSFDATQLIGMPVKFEHDKRKVGEYTFAKNTDDHSIYVKGWVDDPKVCELIRSGDVKGLSPKVFFKADDSRRTVKQITKIEEGSVVQNPACKVCFISWAS